MSWDFGPTTPWRVALLAVSLVAPAGCLLVTNLDDLSGGRGGVDGGLAGYAIGGTMRGLDEGTVTLAVNASDYFTVEGDGPFAFPVRLESGAGYLVKVLRTSDGRTCQIMRGDGTVADADVTTIDVHCPSSNAQLSNLTWSTGPLAPSFEKDVTSYIAPGVASDLFLLDPDVALTATTASRTATVTINGVLATSGTSTSVGGLHLGANTVTVAVRAADGVTEKAYTIGLTDEPQDAYIKPSNKSAGFIGFSFGTSVALSGDGSTLAVGTPYEQGPGRGVNPNQTTDPLSAETGAVYVFRRTASTWVQEAYVKASNARPGARFGCSVALSGDGNTLAVGSTSESSVAAGIDGDQSDTSARGRGAAYVFHRTAAWAQGAYFKPSDGPAEVSGFGFSVALSADGTALAVGANADRGLARGINGDPLIGSPVSVGAAYLFRHLGSGWTREAYFKPSNAARDALFGWSVALSSLGASLVVGAPYESSAARGVNGKQDDEAASRSGAAYVFGKTGSTWAQEAYLKASNTRKGNEFGKSVAVSSDGTRIAVGAPYDPSAAVGVDGDAEDTSALDAGSVFVFGKAGTTGTWAQQAYLKASNAGPAALFGRSIALSGDGHRLLVGAPEEMSAAKGINGNQKDVSAQFSGAAYAFLLSGSAWSQKAYVKPSNTSPNMEFGTVALSSNGSVFAVAAPQERSAALGINGNQVDMSQIQAGAVYVFR